VAILDATLKAALARTLKRDVAKLKPYWDGVIPVANKSGYDEITGALANRGYALASILSWDRFNEFQESLGLFWCGVYGAAHFMANEGELLAEFDRREELKTVAVTIGGVVVPVGGGSGPIGHGKMTSGTEVFQKPCIRQAW
jgi:hypothetical protein